jgi:hypothetical protein
MRATLHGVGQGEGRDGPGQPEAPRARVADQGAVGDQGPHHLLDEEGVALGPAEDLGAERLGQRAAVEQPVDERAAVRGAEGHQRQLLEGHAGVAGRGGPDAHRGLGGLGPGGDPQGQPGRGGEREEVLGERHRGLVHPVPVL